MNGAADATGTADHSPDWTVDVHPALECPEQTPTYRITCEKLTKPFQLTSGTVSDFDQDPGDRWERSQSAVLATQIGPWSPSMSAMLLRCTMELPRSPEASPAAGLTGVVFPGALARTAAVAAGAIPLGGLSSRT
ncbi:hypothetical protein VTI28DRAFT_5926 [Corynascus sepedonium]